MRRRSASRRGVVASKRSRSSRLRSRSARSRDARSPFGAAEPLGRPGDGRLGAQDVPEDGVVEALEHPRLADWGTCRAPPRRPTRRRRRSGPGSPPPPTARGRARKELAAGVRRRRRRHPQQGHDNSGHRKRAASPTTHPHAPSSIDHPRQRSRERTAPAIGASLTAQRRWFPRARRRAAGARRARQRTPAHV